MSLWDRKKVRFLGENEFKSVDEHINSQKISFKLQLLSLCREILILGKALLEVSVQWYIEVSLGRIGSM